MFQCSQHHIAHDVAAVARSRRRPTHRLTVAAVQGKGHPQGAAIVTAELEPIRTPALVAVQNSHLTVVAACAAACGVTIAGCGLASTSRPAWR